MVRTSAPPKGPIRGFVSAVLITMLVLSTSCDDFLNVESDNQLSRSDLFQNARGANAAVVGLYFLLGSADYYQIRMPIYADLPGNSRPPVDGGGNLADLRGIQRGLAALHSRQLTPVLDDTNLDNLYVRAYKILFQANDILAGLSLVEDAQPGQLESLEAEVLTIRAFIHFDLVRLFAQAPGFSPDASHPGIALIDGVPGIFDLPARSSVAETYDLILADLDRALAGLDPNFTRRSSDPYWITPAVIHGLTAKVNAYTGDWATCLQHASLAISTTGKILTPASQYLAGWSEGNLSEIMWELDLQSLLDDADDVQFQSPARIIGTGREDSFMEVSEDVLAAHADNDLRLGLYSRSEEENLLQCSKWPFAINEIRNPPILRLSELHLLRAEANAELGDLAKATADYLLIHRRAVSEEGDVVPTDQEGLRQAIRLERRRELAFEGHHFFDLGRWGVPLERADCSPVLEGDCDIPYPDPRFVLPIPFEAIQLNPNLRQNPGY